MAHVPEHLVSSWQHVRRAQPCWWALRVCSLASLPALTLGFSCADEKVTASFLIHGAMPSFSLS